MNVVSTIEILGDLERLGDVAKPILRKFEIIKKYYESMEIKYNNKHTAYQLKSLTEENYKLSAHNKELLNYTNTNKPKCAICKTNIANCATYPCKHLCMCEKCKIPNKKCPKCGKNVTAMIDGIIF